MRTELAAYQNLEYSVLFLLHRILSLFSLAAKIDRDLLNLICNLHQTIRENGIVSISKKGNGL